MFDPFSISVLQLFLPLNSPPSTIVTWRRCNILLTLLHSSMLVTLFNVGHIIQC